MEVFDPLETPKRIKKYSKIMTMVIVRKSYLSEV